LFYRRNKSNQGYVASDDKYWDDLTQLEQAALIVLGYDKEYWDNR